MYSSNLARSWRKRQLIVSSFAYPIAYERAYAITSRPAYEKGRQSANHIGNKSANSAGSPNYP
jgi:hypothetical protein